MAYGLQITGANNITQLDTQLTSTVQLVVFSEGATLTNNAAIAGYTTGDFIVGRPTSGSGAFSSNFASNPPTLNVPGTYKILRAVSGSGATSETANGTGYGLTVYKADGTTKVFDSRSSANGFGIETIWSKAGLYGAKQTSGSLTTANNTVSSTLTSNTMVGLNGGMGNLNGFWFDNVGSQVLYNSYIAFGGFLGLGDVPIANFSEVIAGEFK